MIQALVLAAGKSSRIACVAGDLPKPLLSIKGEPVLVHNLKLCARYGIKKVWINLHHQAERIRERIGSGRKWRLSVGYSYERELLGTAGAVKKIAGDLRNGTFLVLYGDNFTNCNLKEMLNFHRKKGALATVAVFRQSKNVNSGIAGGSVVADQEEKIIGFLEGDRKKVQSRDFVNAGIYALEPKMLNYIPNGFSDFGRDIFPAILKLGLGIFAYRMKGFCLAMDTPESYARAQKLAFRLKI